MGAQPAFDLFTYPAAAGHKGGRDTGKAAAQAISRSAPRLRSLCVDQLRIYGPLTADEIAENLGIDKLSIRPRLSELTKMGRVRDSGQRRRNRSGKTALAYELVP